MNCLHHSTLNHAEYFDSLQSWPFTLTLESAYTLALTLEYRNKGIDVVVTTIIRSGVSWIWTCYSLKNFEVCLQIPKSKGALIIRSWSRFFVQKHAEKRERYLILLIMLFPYSFYSSSISFNSPCLFISATYLIPFLISIN